jgi:predicted ester cyclase
MNKKSLLAMLCLGTLAAGANAVQAKKATNRQAVDRFFEVVDGQQFDKFADVETPDMVMKTPMGVMNGIEGHKQMTHGFATAFPNFKHTISQCVEAGDLISCEGKFTGDHNGPMMMPNGKSIPATHKHVEFEFAGFGRVKNGKVAEMHAYFDNLAMMRQLGLMPSGS